MAGRKSIQQEEHSLNSKITVLQEISYAIVHKKNISELLHQILEILSSRLNMIRGTLTIVKHNILKQLMICRMQKKNIFHII